MPSQCNITGLRQPSHERGKLLVLTPGRADPFRRPGAERMRERYVQFRLELPAVARAANLDVLELNLLDYRTLVTGWLDENSW